MKKVRDKLKDKLIHLLGGYTHEEMMIRVRPERTFISSFSIRTLKMNKLIRKCMLEHYPEYQELSRKDMAYMIGDKMLEEGLIEFGRKEDNPETITMTALARIVVPAEVFE